MSANMSESSGTSDAPSTAPHGRRSKVWEHFEQDLVFVGDVPKAVCKYCAMKLTCNRKSGTSSLLSHISESCRLIGAEVRSRFLATLKKKSTDVGFVFDRKRSRQLMIKFCIHAEIPFKKFDDPYFEEWMDSMQPTFKVVGRHTVRSDCILTHDEMKDQLKLELQSLDSRICLTSDMWTSVQKLGYMCVTVHYIDANFVLKKKIISFKVVKYPHTKEAIEEALSRCLTEWGIKRKLFTITLDNAANNTGAVNNFLETQDHGLMLEGVDFHVRCCAHILNIVAQDGTQHIDVSVEKIRDLFRHVNSSGGRIQAFNTLATNKGLPEKAGLFLDIKTRWNSTFQMLVEAIKYRGVLNSYASDNGEVTLNAKEWTDAEVICDFLKAFEEATNAVSADRKPTSQHFLHMVLCIRNALRDPQWKVNEGMHKLAISMGSKFDKYWNETKLNAALVIATVLDPRKKEDYLEFFFEKYCENYAESEKAMNGVSKSMKSYYQLYEEKVKRSSEYLVSREANINVGSPVLGKRKLEEEFARYRSSRRNFQPRSELDAYLEENFIESENFEILTWWKLNGEKYPVLSAMARDFLAVPLSTVSSESAFSCGGRILGDTRASLKPHALEALVCGKDWLIKVPSNEGPRSEIHFSCAAKEGLFFPRSMRRRSPGRRRGTRRGGSPSSASSVDKTRWGFFLHSYFFFQGMAKISTLVSTSLTTSVRNPSVAYSVRRSTTGLALDGDFFSIHIFSSVCSLRTHSGAIKIPVGMDAGNGKLVLQSKNVCVVGGGMAGLAAARELRREGHAVTVMEQSGDVGGQWLYDPRTDGADPLGAVVPVRVPSSIYACLRLISPREAMGFSDFQFLPREGDDHDPRRFPGHREVHSYLREFCDAFGLMDAVRLNTRVLRVAAAAAPVTSTAGQWAVRSVRHPGGGTDDAAAHEVVEEVFDAVVVATGHYSQPMLPSGIEGMEEWSRRQLHGHSYRTPEPFRGETVVVVGCGDSGKDIALDLCRVAREVHLAANAFSMEEATTPAMSRMLANHGEVLRLHPRICRLHAEGRVEFADGSSVVADSLIYCTGYRYSFPFLDTGGAVTVEDEVVGPLFEHVFPPSLAPSLSFVGVPRKILVPWFFETQAKWVAQVLSGRRALPPEEEMLRAVEEHYRSRESAGVPRKLTHNIGGVEPLKMYEFGEKYCDFAPLEEWKKELIVSSILSMKDDAETFRDHTDDSEKVQKGLRAWRGLAARPQDG